MLNLTALVESLLLRSVQAILSLPVQLLTNVDIGDYTTELPILPALLASNTNNMPEEKAMFLSYIAMIRDISFTEEPTTKKQ
jgi:hypothetical protein